IDERRFSRRRLSEKGRPVASSTATTDGGTRTGVDLTALRADFPTIRPDETYLDSVASSLTPMAVVDAMTEYYTTYRANIHRGTYDLSMRASERFDAAVRTVADFIGALPQEIV